MDDNMHPTDDRKNPLISVPPRLILVRNETADQWLERTIQDWAIRAKDANGVYASEALAYTARGKRWPGRLGARLLGDALIGGCSLEWVGEYPGFWTEFLRRRARELARRTPEVA